MANGSTLVYFTPQDENTSTTVLFLYNTGTADANVAIQTFQLNGNPWVDTSVAGRPDSWSASAETG